MKDPDVTAPLKDSSKVLRRTYLLIFVTAGIACLCCIFLLPSVQNVSDYWHFFFLGLGGAIVANSTGAGGGIVFIPAFTSLGLDDVNSLGTSLAIQCFGMTAGSISWLTTIYQHKHGGSSAIRLTHRLILFAGTSAVLGMLSGQYLLPTPPLDIATIFRVFSIIFGVLLLVITLRRTNHRHTISSLRKRDIPPIVLVCFAGGLVTSWISIGAGEWLAILLFFLGYPTMIIVCVAVCISSATVISGIPFHIWETQSIVWPILLFAAPAAIIGGAIARMLAERLGPTRLKIFFSTWIIATGIAM